jgi:hypothetical protein
MKAEVGVRWVVTWWEPEATNRKGGWRRDRIWGER